MVREVVFFSFFSFRCLLPHHFERSAWFLETTDLPAGPKERGVGGLDPILVLTGSTQPEDLSSPQICSFRLQDRPAWGTALHRPCPSAQVRASAQARGWAAHSCSARRPGTAGNRSCPWVQRDREERSLADTPGGRQKHICVFDLILKQIRESVGNGVGPIPSNIIIVVFMVFHF